MLMRNVGLGTLQCGSFRRITCLHVMSVNISNICKKIIVKLWRQIREREQSPRMVEKWAMKELKLSGSVAKDSSPPERCGLLAGRVTDVSKYRTAFIFMMKQAKKNIIFVDCGRRRH